MRNLIDFMKLSNSTEIKMNSEIIKVKAFFRKQFNMLKKVHHKIDFKLNASNCIPIWIEFDQEKMC